MTLEERWMSRGYRESHQAKGADYHDTFCALPHRAMLWRMEQTLLTRLVGELFPDRRPTYLDFACGTGRILGHLAPLTRAPVGIDVSASMLAVARKNVPAAEIFEADLTREDPLGERRFELVTAFRFFPNAEPELRSAAIRALAGHLEPEGVLVFNNHKHSASLSRRVSRLLGRLPAPEVAARSGDRSMSHQEALDLVAGAGLRIAARYPMAALPFTELHMLRPHWLLEALERALGRVPASSAIAQNLVYVCRR